MPQISKKYLKEEKLKRIFDIFFGFLSDVKNKTDSEKIINEILTETEKIMIAKRLACFYLLKKNVSAEVISDSINLSTSTVYYLKQVLDDSINTQKYLQNKIKKEKLNNFIEDILMETFFEKQRVGSNWSQNMKDDYLRKQRRLDPL